MKKYSFTFFLILGYFFNCLAIGAPLITEPTFSRLSTENGLSQNTVNSMLLDSDGFLWSGTEAGLNRFDGYQNNQVFGPDNEFSDSPIIFLFQDSNGMLWVSDAISGVHQFNLQTNKIQQTFTFASSYRAQTNQSANFIHEDEYGDIWFALQERIVKYSYATQQLVDVYHLTDEQLQQYEDIRTLLIADEVLFIGTTHGLYALDKKGGQATPITYTSETSVNNDSHNVKVLALDQNDNLWIGTVKGLYSLPLSQTLEFVGNKQHNPLGQLHIKDHNIWQLAEAQNNLFYLATDHGLYSYELNNKQLQHIFLPTDSHEYLASDVLKTILFDQNKNLWLGSKTDGVIYWSPKTTFFNKIHNTKGGRENKVLSSDNVLSFYQPNPNYLWIGTDKGLDQYNFLEGEISHFLIPRDNNSGESIQQILPGPQGHQLILHTSAGFFGFDTHSKEKTKLTSQNQADILDSEIWHAYSTKQQNLWLVGERGFFEYSPTTQTIKSLSLIPNDIKVGDTLSFIDGLPDKPNTTLISTYGGLWELHDTTGQLTLLHALPEKQKNAQIYPGKVLLGRDNTLWIAYHGYGLVGIDAQTYQQKYLYDRNNLLPSNAISDMQLDADGNIWISTNVGLIKFFPESQHAQKYAIAQGLAGLEFNLNASLTLTDGRMVFGSPKGLTFFDPKNFTTEKTNNFDVAITNIALSSGSLSLPLNNLDKQSLHLSHADLGLSIQFSTLQFQNQDSTRYRYQLSGSDELVYPITSRPEVMFPKFDAGQYRFSVSAFNPDTGIQSRQAYIDIHVYAPPWASPLAYTAYAIVLIISFLLFWRYRRAHNLRLFNAHQQAIHSKNKLTLALSASNSDMWEYHTAHDLFFAPRLNKELGYKDTVNYEHHFSLIHNADKVRYEKAWTEFLNNQGENELDITFRMISQKGKWLWFHDVGRIVKTNQQGQALLVTGTYSNVTETIADRNSLRLFGEAFKHTLDWVIIYNHKYYPIAFNDAFAGAFGLKEHANAASELKKLLKKQTKETAKFWRKMSKLKAGDSFKGEDKLVLENGSTCDIMVNIHVVGSEHEKNKIEHFLVIITDISEQKTAEAKLLALANFDSLTHLPNRNLLLDRVERGLEHAKRHTKNMALFFIDLDKFKQVNDSLGHKAGDELLVVIARRLTNKLRKEDTVARLGGDEFVIMIENVQCAETISVLVSEISHIIDLPISLSNQTVSVSSSIGISMYPGDGHSAEELLKNADIAMYHAKEQGRSNFQFFTQKMDELVKGRLVLENQLKAAHKAQSFQNYYQPIVNTQSKGIEGFEILMRWPSKNGMVSPDKFIPVSEELGLIEQMTFDAFERAIPVFQSIRQNGFEGYLSFNLSAKHFDSQSSIERIILLLEQHQIPVTAIRFEITESALMKDHDKALVYMTQIQDKGFKIALDDFGTGYSSLKYLKEFPINVIKIDKSFVDDIGKNKNNEAIILTTLSMAKQLGMTCIAEGIEALPQVEFFKQHQCFHLQGYYFSKPVPASELDDLLNTLWLE